MLDYLIRNASIADGTGAPIYRANVGIADGKLTIIAEGEPLPDAGKVIDAEGMLLCPGFIDIHSHADVTLPFSPQCDSLLMQGITTFVGGNCGMGIAPAHKEDFIESYMMQKLLLKGHLHVQWKSFADWLDFAKKLPLGANYVPLVAHNALRGSVLGSDISRYSTEEERKQIAQLLNEALDAGAFGMSYTADPGQAGHYADDAELDELFSLLEARNSYITAHTRHHQNQWVSDDGRNYYGVYVGEPGDVICGRYHGLLSFLEHARKTPKLRCAYSHLTNAFLAPIPHSQAMENAMVEETLRVFMDEPLAEGLDIYFNMIPCAPSLSSVQRVTYDLKLSLNYDAELKPYASEEKLVDALSNAEFREKLKTYIKSGKFKMGMLSPATDPYWSDCYAFCTAKDESLLGRTLMDITKERFPGSSRTQLIYNHCLEVLFDLVCADPAIEWALIKDKREYQGADRLIQHPRCSPMTDTGAFPANSDKNLNVIGYGNPPLAYTVFVRYLVQMCREKGLITLEDAIRRITTLPASIMNLSDRGQIAEGMQADLVLLDWDNLGFDVDYNNPSLPPKGIRYVFVNGTPALEEGELTYAATGKVITKA